MKKLFASFLAIAAFSAAAFAQEQREMKPGKHGMGHHGKGDGGRMMADLNLTDAQKTQMKSLHEEFRTKMETLESNKTMSVADYKTQKAALHKERHDKMQSILTAEQKKQMEDKKAQHEGKKGEKFDKRLDAMKSKLSLSDDQVSKLKSQHEATKAKMEAIKGNQSLSPEDKKQQMMTLKDAAKAERKNILTAEQLKKFEEMKKDHKKGKRSKDAK